MFQYNNVTYCGTSQQQVSVLTRQVSRTGDTITYTMQTWLATHIVGGRFYTWLPVPGITYSTSVTTLRVSSASLLTVLTSYYQSGQYSMPVASSATQFGGRPTYLSNEASRCPLSVRRAWV